MAVSTGYFPLIFTFFLCFSPNSIIPVLAETNEIVDEVCKSTKIINFCRTVIYSDPLAETANRRELVGIAFRHAYESTNIATDKIESWIQSSRLGPSDVTLVGMNKCLGFYRSAVKSIGRALDDIDSDKYDRLVQAATEVAGYARNCKASFNGGPGPATVSENNRDLHRYSVLCIAFSGSLNPKW